MSKDGRTILADTLAAINRSGATMDIHRAYTHLPLEHRQAVRRDETYNARQALEQGRQQMREWADQVSAEAKRRLNRDDLDTPAAETRRLRNELEVQRLIASGKDMPRKTADDLLERARQAYLDGKEDQAWTLATAANTLSPGNVRSAQVIKAVEEDRVMRDPAKASALRELADVDVVVDLFDRDAGAAMSRALQYSASLAKDLGEPIAVQRAREEASLEGRRAKLATFLQSQASGTSYQEPEGVVPGLPQGIDPRGPSQPDGAHLPTPEERDALLRAAGVKQ